MFRPDWDIIRLIEYVEGGWLYIMTIINPWIEVSSLWSHKCNCKDEISVHEIDNCNEMQQPPSTYSISLIMTYFDQNM